MPSSKQPAADSGRSVNPSPFRVIVVGAGVAGLTTSHCLQKAGIDHVVLERRTNVAPPMGSSIAMYPNGCRILHQLGCLEKMKASCTPCTYSWTNGPDGKVIVGAKFFDVVRENHGQDIFILERRQYLQNLFDCLPDQSRIRLGCEVKVINQDENGVEVVLADGTVEKGDILIGADGVRSPVRSVMWECANKKTPGLITAKEKTCMKTRWKLLLGMGPAAPELGFNDMTVSHDSNYSLMCLTQPDHCYFSAFFKLDQEYSWPTIKRYTAEEAEEAAASIADHPVSDTIVFGELWKKRERASLIGIEEGVLDHWFNNRIVLVGDCVHKMTPNIGLGGNMALESVTVLCNHLHATLASHKGTKPTLAALTQTFQAYQDERRPRALDIMTFSSQVTDSHAWVSAYHKYYTKWWMPRLSYRAFPDAMGEIIRRGPKLSFIDCAQFGQGRLPWKDDDGSFKFTGDSQAKLATQWATSAVVVLAIGLGALKLGHVLSPVTMT